MQNPRLSARYAKSIIGLAIERNELEKVYEDMLYLQGLIKASREFVVLIKSPVVTADKKQIVIDALTTGKISELTHGFIRLLVNKSRESNLPEIISAFIEQYKQFKNIHTIKLTTATPVSEELKNEIVKQVRSQTAFQNIDLATEVKEDIIGGFVLQIGDTLVDASISYDLNEIRKQFLNNDFVYNIR
jgi:F-type H+-transporting ATPase subunit delta